MKKKLLTILLVGVLGLSVTGCDGDDGVIHAHIEYSDKASAADVVTIGRNALVEIDGGLCYDSTTGIVYWWNGFFYKRLCNHPNPLLFLKRTLL